MSLSFMEIKVVCFSKKLLLEGYGENTANSLGLMVFSFSRDEKSHTRVASKSMTKIFTLNVPQPNVPVILSKPI